MILLYTEAKKMGCKICKDCEELINNNCVRLLDTTDNPVYVTPQMWTPKKDEVYHATIDVKHIGKGSHTITLCGKK